MNHAPGVAGYCIVLLERRWIEEEYFCRMPCPAVLKLLLQVFFMGLCALLLYTVQH